MLPPDAELISVDDHLIEPPRLWLDRLPAKYAEEAPRVIENEVGGHSWLFAGKLTPLTSGIGRVRDGIDESSLPARTDRNDLPSRFVRFDQIRPGCYDPVARLEDMDIDGVHAQLLFPQFGRFAGHRFLDTPDTGLALACIRAYNDFLLDEWCAAAPDRYIGLAVLPLWDPVLSAAEVRRAAAKGALSIAFSENPTLLGFPSIHTDHWDVLWDAVAETGLPICMHIGSGGKVITSSKDAPGSIEHVLAGTNSMVAAADWVFSGIFERYPDLQVALSESGAGWVPYFRERARVIYERRGAITGAKSDPNELFNQHMCVCAVSDAFASEVLEAVGVDNVMWESDYPHDESWWPHSREVFRRQMADVPDEWAVKVASGNARRVFKLPQRVEAR
jgi:predicted TIM-barrel fold metal-dependent hydrolase